MALNLFTCFAIDVNDKIHSMVIKIGKEVNFHHEKNFAIPDRHGIENVSPLKLHSSTVWHTYMCRHKLI